MFTAGEATAIEAVEEDEAFRFLLTSPSGKQRKKKLGPSGGSMAGEKDSNLQYVVDLLQSSYLFTPFSPTFPAST
ncbi:hypothetical protein C1H46_014017 [Malus baccata]|uniref:Uncharacterized protein n=1 Tax=Malus baccata TaxID=106549 RepID=A0A540MNL2_MALBA|nr:hypothetical protein C1H46_014017 [Malus baccata]